VVVEGEKERVVNKENESKPEPRVTAEADGVHWAALEGWKFFSISQKRHKRRARPRRKK